MIDSMIAMLSDSNASMGAIVMDRGPLGKIFPEYVDYLDKNKDLHESFYDNKKSK